MRSSRSLLTSFLPLACFALLAFAVPSLSAATPPTSPATAFDDIKARATPDELYRLLFALPKGGDLHHHGGGSLPMEFVIDYYTNPARNRSQKYYIRTSVAPLLVSAPDLTPDVTPDVTPDTNPDVTPDPHPPPHFIVNISIFNVTFLLTALTEIYRYGTAPNRYKSPLAVRSVVP
jgi:hypothetical protein